VIKVEDWSEIRRLHRGEGMPIKGIARRLKISRNTVRSALAAASCTGGLRLGSVTSGFGFGSV
jgi:DNA-binding transcriptional regulator LsrR (DeoR family)